MGKHAESRPVCGQFGRKLGSNRCGRVGDGVSAFVLIFRRKSLAGIACDAVRKDDARCRENTKLLEEGGRGIIYVFGGQQNNIVG